MLALIVLMMGFLFVFPKLASSISSGLPRFEKLLPE